VKACLKWVRKEWGVSVRKQKIEIRNAGVGCESASLQPAAGAGPWHVGSPRGQDRIKQRWNPPNLEARTALLRLI